VGVTTGDAMSKLLLTIVIGTVIGTILGFIYPLGLMSYDRLTDPSFDPTSAGGYIGIMFLTIPAFATLGGIVALIINAFTNR
jgi:hypothetical protein